MNLLRSLSRATVVLGLILVGRTFASTASFVLLHTNDLHDHVRAVQGANGGLPRIAAYVQQVRAERQDVILLDAGDVTEKGDLVADRTNGVITYEAIRRIGYDAVTLGNHDWDPDYVDAAAYERALGQPILNINLLKPDGSHAFTPSRVLTIGALKVGVIGAITPQKQNCLDQKETGRAIAREAKRLRSEVHLIVAVCHEGSKVCASWAKQAPDVNIFVSGHTHEFLPHPIVVKDSGALIVQAGSYAQHVGRLDLVVDLEQRRIVSARDTMVELPAGKAPIETGLAAWVRAREESICPEANRVLVSDNPDLLDRVTIATLSAEALRHATKADVAFCSAERMIRSQVYPGLVDVNAWFVATGLGRATVVVELTGAEINAYLSSLQQRHKDKTDWSGMKASRKGNSWITSLTPERTYRVAMTKLEWTSRFLRAVAQETRASKGDPLSKRKFEAQEVKLDITSAFGAYLQGMPLGRGETLKQRADVLAQAVKL